MQSRMLIALVSLSLAGANLALAHAYLEQSAPADGEVLRVLPKTVRLQFSEALEPDFSTFKIIKLQTTETQIKRINADAATLMNKTLLDRMAKRADLGLETSSPSNCVAIKLAEKLKPGWYVVMWKVLSIDTHTTSDFFVFKYQP